jgi:Ni,Fe-hydrogenase I cytochrome b subunit
MVRFMRYLIVSSFFKSFLILCAVNKTNNLFCQGKQREKWEKGKKGNLKAGVNLPFLALLHSFHNPLTRKGSQFSIVVHVG